MEPRRNTDARRRAEHHCRRRIRPLARRPTVPRAAARRRRPLRPARLRARRPGCGPGAGNTCLPRWPPYSGATPSTPKTSQSSRRPSRSCAACTTRAAITSGGTTSATSPAPSGWHSPRTAWTHWSATRHGWPTGTCPAPCKPRSRNSATPVTSGPGLRSRRNRTCRACSWSAASSGTCAPAGRFGFVMPLAALSRRQFAGFRAGPVPGKGGLQPALGPARRQALLLPRPGLRRVRRASRHQHPIGHTGRGLVRAATRAKRLPGRRSAVHHPGRRPGASSGPSAAVALRAALRERRHRLSARSCSSSNPGRPAPWAPARAGRRCAASAAPPRNAPGSDLPALDGVVESRIHPAPLPRRQRTAVPAPPAPAGGDPVGRQEAPRRQRRPARRLPGPGGLVAASRADVERTPVKRPADPARTDSTTGAS